MNPLNLRMPNTGDADESLRALEWSALLARLGAERDLRREFAASGGTARTVADFLNGAALVAGDSSLDAQSINPETLANRKSTGGITAAVRAKSHVAKQDARGKQ